MSKRQHACPEQATARRMSRMLVPLQKPEILLFESSRPTTFNLILDGMNGFSAKIGSIVPLGRGYFPHDPRHFVPGYDRAVPPGQNTPRPPRLCVS
jgi:hypothetical protein